MDHGSANVGTTPSLPGQKVDIDFFDVFVFYLKFLKNDEWPRGESTKIHSIFLISRLLGCCSNMS